MVFDHQHESNGVLSERSESKDSKEIVRSLGSN